MLKIKKTISVLVIFYIFLFLFSSSVNADLYVPPERSPCFKDEVFIMYGGDEPPLGDWLGNLQYGKEQIEMRRAIECLRYKRIVSDYCKEITTENYFIKEAGGYCISVENYCSLTGCVPEEKKEKMARLPFYSKSPFFNKKRTHLSPIYKEIKRLGGVVSIFKTIGSNFLLNLLFICIILITFKKSITKKVSWYGLKFLGKIALVTLIGFVMEAEFKYLPMYALLRLQSLINPEAIIYRSWIYLTIEKYSHYPFIFLFISTLAYFIIFRPISFKNLKSKILASILFGVLSNPFWMLFLRPLIGDI